jgi:membrane fusion protein (multidrug efflux system)
MDQDTQRHERQDDNRDDAHEDDRDAGNKKPESRDQEEGQADKKPAVWPWIVAGAVLAGFVAVVLWIVFAPQPDVWTDDAYVMVHYATIAPRVSGQVTRVAVNDNQMVHAGDLLAELDPRDYRVAVAQAEAALAHDQAQVRDAAANLARQPALIAEQEASLAAARARLGFAQADQRRYANLAATGAGTRQQHQQADATLREDEESVRQSSASVDAARRQMQVLQAELAAMQAVAQSDQARLDQARLNLSYTRIVAPVDGMVGERSVQVGNFVSPGAELMTVVPLDRVYVIANYREEALRHVRAGQHATVHVDAYNIKLDAVVDSVPPASGAVFSPIPPNNATGNFTKIVQRLPVKIDIVPGQPLALLLRAGFSVETTIHTGLENVVADQAASPHRITVH